MINKNKTTLIHQCHTKPLERMDIVHDEKTIVNQRQCLLLVDDDEIFDNDGDVEDTEDEDDDENFADLPPTSNTIDLTRNDSKSSEFSHIKYVDSIRKTRPLPKIPDRTSSKELPSNMTAVLNESFRNKTRVSAQQLFQMLNQKNSEEIEDEVDTSDDDIEYGGVFALKTQMPSPTLSNKEVLKQYYDELNLNYKTMTPVEEVDEDQLVERLDIQGETTFNYTLEPSELKPRPGSEISLQPPSLESGRSSPTSSRNSRQSMDLSDPPLDLDFDFKTPKQANDILQIPNEQPQQFDTINGISSLYATPTDGCSYGAPQPSSGNDHETDGGYCISTSNNQDAISNRHSLYGDVQKLSDLNQALMTPEISNSSIPAPSFHQQKPEQLSGQILHNNHQQKNQALASMSSYNKRADPRMSMTSASLVHDKESMKTYRRMATKTNDRNIQFTYAKYLMQLVAIYVGSNEPSVVATRDRLQEEVEYWVDKLAKSNYAAALYTKGQWLRHCRDSKAIGIFVGAQYKKVNHTKAFKCFQQAAKYGSVEAYYELAEYWMVRKDYKKSMECYRYAASKKHILSLYVKYYICD